MIIISADIPKEIIDLPKLEEIVGLEYTLEIFTFETSLYADNSPVMKEQEICLQLTTGRSDTRFRIVNRLRYLEIKQCAFDLIVYLVTQMVDQLKTHQRAAWDYYSNNRRRI